MNFFKFLIRQIKKIFDAIMWTFFEKNMLAEQKRKKLSNKQSDGALNTKRTKRFGNK